MDGYKSLQAWRAAQELCLKVLEITDERRDTKTWAVLDQLRRAVISVDVNIVEGYALGTAPLFRRHLRIALGSAAEAERLLTIATARGYLSLTDTTPLVDLANRSMRLLYGLLRSRNLPFPPSNR
jgi:four helix bundle protein